MRVFKISSTKFMQNQDKIYSTLASMFPDAHCELNYNNIFELLIAVVLSAQTTDISVNKVTPLLFEKYPTPEVLALAKYDDVVNILKTLGLAATKAKNIIALSEKLTVEKNGIVEADFDYLITLPGVGKKTANVILSEGFKIPAIAVDTHVLRVSNRLGLVKSDDVSRVEEELKKIYPRDIWHDLHLKLLFFGRYFCKAKTPSCNICPFTDFCTKK